ncbi:MAG: SgcJ/EcaC family oxidoreductase [Armatimonadota bacterium]
MTVAITPDLAELQYRLWSFWNDRDAAGMASLFMGDANVIGFDGSQIDGRRAIEQAMGAVFKDHKPGRYVGKVLEARLIGPNVAVVRSIAGMVPDGATELKPELNAVVSLVAERNNDGWKITLYQNTPAQLHGRPEDVAKMTAELTAFREA